MPLELKRILKDWFKPGIEAGLITTLIALLINFFKLPLVNLTFSAVDINVRQNLVGGLPTDLGSQGLGWLSGLVGFDFPHLLVTLVGTLFIVYVGRILYTWSPLQAKTPVGRLTTVLFIGSIATTLLAAWALSVPAFGTLAALLIYSVLVSLVMWGIGNKFTSLKIPE